MTTTTSHRLLANLAAAFALTALALAIPLSDQLARHLVLKLVVEPDATPVHAPVADESTLTALLSR